MNCECSMLLSVLIDNFRLPRASKLIAIWIKGYPDNDLPSDIA